MREQAGLLVAVANWMILLMNTPWTDHTCCCQIRFQVVRPKSEIRYVLSFMDGSPCQNALSGGHKIRLMGLVLAEVVLMRPFRFRLEDTIPRNVDNAQSNKTNPPPGVGRTFQQVSTPGGRSDHEAEWITVDRDEILRQLQGKTATVVIDAIQFCLESELPEDQTFRAEIKHALCKNVLKLLRQHFQTIDRHQERYNDTLLARGSVDEKMTWPPDKAFDLEEDRCSQWMSNALNKRVEDDIATKGETLGNRSQVGTILFLERSGIPKSYVLALLLLLALAPANFILFLSILHAKKDP